MLYLALENELPGEPEAHRWAQVLNHAASNHLRTTWCSLGPGHAGIDMCVN